MQIYKTLVTVLLSLVTFGCFVGLVVALSKGDLEAIRILAAIVIIGAFVIPALITDEKL